MRRLQLKFPEGNISLKHVDLADLPAPHHHHDQVGHLLLDTAHLEAGHVAVWHRSGSRHVRHWHSAGHYFTPGSASSVIAASLPHLNPFKHTLSPLVWSAARWSVCVWTVKDGCVWIMSVYIRSSVRLVEKRWQLSRGCNIIAGRCSIKTVIATTFLVLQMIMELLSPFHTNEKLF